MSEDITFHFKDVESEGLHLDGIAEWVQSVVTHHERSSGELAFVFMSDDALLDVNRKFLNHDYYTDVITFPFDSPGVSGDILISLDRIRENAADHKVSFDEELRRVMIHGVLHLIGFEDKDDKAQAEMRLMEDEALNMWT